MKLDVQRVLELFRFLLVFCACALLCYGLIMLLSDRFLPANPYRQPQGNAIKVITLLKESEQQELSGYQERLQLFYLLGE